MPVATGVVRLEGSSEVKIVALEGEMRYFAVRMARRASLNPIWISVSMTERKGKTKNFTRLLFYSRSRR